MWLGIMSILDKIFIKNPDILMESEDDGALLFNQDSGEIKILNPTCATIYENIDGKTSGREIVKKLLNIYECEKEEEIIHDVEEMLSVMRDSNLLVVEASNV